MILFNLIAALGFLLRLYGLDKFSLWFDEAESILSAIPPVRIVGVLKAGYPLISYKLFIYIWKFFGIGEFILRLSSVIFGTLSIIAIYYLARLFFEKKIALLSAFIISISPFHIYYSQELRPYILLSLLTMCSVYCFIKGMRDKKIIYWVFYIIFSIINLYAHLISSIVLISCLIYFILYHKKYKDLFRILIMSNLLIIISAIPLLLSAFVALRLLSNQDTYFYKISVGWIPLVNYKSIFWTLKNFTVGYNVNAKIYVVAVTIYILLFFKGLLYYKAKKDLVFILILFFLPLIFLFFISKYYIPCYVDRYLIASSVFYYLIIARGISRMRRTYRLVTVGIFLIISTVSLKNYYNNFLASSFIEHRGVQEKKQEREAVKFILENLGTADGIVHVCRSSVLPFEYYFRYADKLKLASKKYDYPQLLIIADEIGKDNPKLYRYSLVINEIDKDYVYRPFNDSLDKFKRIWLIYSGWDFYLVKQSGSSENKILDWMNLHYDRAALKNFSGLDVYLFVKKNSDKLSFPAR